MRLLWSEVKHESLAQIATRLRGISKQFGAVTMADLVAPAEFASTGLYFFSSDAGWEYIGRAASRALIERIPSHLDLRPESYFGTLLKKLSQRRGTGVRPAQCVEEALRMSLAMLVADELDTDISTAEDVFRHGLAPVLNSPRKRRWVDMDGLLLQDIS